MSTPDDSHVPTQKLSRISTWASDMSIYTLAAVQAINIIQKHVHVMQLLTVQSEWWNETGESNCFHMAKGS